MQKRTGDVMASNGAQEQLTKYLTDAHSIEQQALAQMKVAPELAGDGEIASAFSKHLEETEEHERLVREQLESRGASPSKLKDLAGTLTGMGFAAFARAQPDTPGKLVVHAFSYEHMEQAAYELLASVAARAGDTETVQTARTIGRQEMAMGQRLEGCFDRAVDAALRALEREDIQQQLDKYLADAHAIEAQALQLLDKAPQLAGTADLASVYDEHHSETEEHQKLVDARLKARGGSPSSFKDAALRLGALNWGAFFQAQPDTPAKLVAFAYAFEHLEIGAYELLRRVAARASDPETEQTAERILVQERAAADKLHTRFEQALDASLEPQRVGAR
jgi:ferritin-like metal-binding protein YciE